ncbi:MAG: tyrosine-type recombinase/integrase [Alphaproteobacteria bacterium]
MTSGRDEQIDDRALTSAGDQTPVEPVAVGHLLSREEFHRLAAVPPAVEWFANIDNANTRRAYHGDVSDFSGFVGLQGPEDMRLVTRAHILAWRHHLAERKLADATIRRKLAAVSTLFAFLADRNAIDVNPVSGVKRPVSRVREGASPALSAEQARRLLDAPDPATLIGRRDRAILATLLFHGLRRAELCALEVGDRQQRRGTAHLRIHGKGGKIRYLPARPEASERIEDYLRAAGHGADLKGALFRPLRSRTPGGPGKPLHPDAVYRIVKSHAARTGIAGDVPGFCPHSLRATAATLALDSGADIARVQDWLDHASPVTTRMYDHRQSRPEDSPTFWIRL